MNDRTIAVHEILRYTKPNAIDRLTHPYRSYWGIQRDPADPESPNVLQEAGINAPAVVRATDGGRLPVLSLRSTPMKSGTAGTPWDDEYRLAEGQILYFGDHKATSRVPLGETAGNKRLLDAWTAHRSSSVAGRASAPPVLVFRTVRVQTGQGSREKGFIEFCGLVVIEEVYEVALRDPTTGREYPNYAAELTVLSLEADHFDWRWVDDRRRRWLTAQQTLENAPPSWKRWVDEGSLALPRIRRREASETPPTEEDHLDRFGIAGTASPKWAGRAPTSLVPRTPSVDVEASNLEMHFHSAFLELLGRLGANAKVTQGEFGPQIHATLSDVDWTLEPQVFLHGCRPDFVLSSSLALPKVAIFTDGAAYHAVPLCNRLADDAVKRASLRDHGIQVLGVTYRDVRLYVDHKSPHAPSWFVPMFAQVFMAHFGYDAAALRVLIGGPFDWLSARIRDPGSTASRGLAAAVPLFFAGGPAHGLLPTECDLGQVAVDHLLGESWPEPSGDAAAWWWQSDHLGVVTRAPSIDCLDIAVVLDDRPEALASPGFAQAWHEWLRLSNALALRGNLDTSIVTVSSVGTRPLSRRRGRVPGS